MIDGALRRRVALPGLHIPLKLVNIDLDISWLAVVPASVWALATIYIPVINPSLSGFRAWTASLVILAAILASLLVHSLAHAAVARVLGCSLPDRIPVYILGDVAQAWPAAPTAAKEALVSITGPVIHGCLSMASYFLWNAQLNPFLNVVSFFLIFFNLGLTAINLTPAFPFDGGRLVRSIIGGLLGRKSLATRSAFYLGLLVSFSIIGWGGFLIIQETSLSLQTGAVTLILAALILYILVTYRVNNVIRVECWPSSRWPAPVTRTIASVLLILVLASVTFSLMPMNFGLEAPGFTASVESMVQMPSQYRYPSRGSFVTNSVILQSPILAGQWVYGQLDGSVKLVAQDKITPIASSLTAFRSSAQVDYQMLLNSETTAVIVGLRLAGYPVDIVGKGSRIISVLPEGPASGILQAGDIITGIDGASVKTQADLNRLLSMHKQGDVFPLQFKRGDKEILTVITTNIPPQWDEPARIGVKVEEDKNDIQMPFPVKIVHQKTDGGPSAGLMFALGVYDLVTPQDLTGGRMIAGTGSINIGGKVGPVGGVPQKVVAAERAGAQYFLCHAWNYPDAAASAKHIKVVKINTVQEAIDFLKSQPPL